MRVKSQILAVILAVALLATGAGAIYELWRVSDLSGKLTKADAKIINLQKQLADANSAIISLQNQSYDSFSAEKALLQRQITQASTTITNLQAQLYEANAKIAGLQRIPNVGEKETIAKDFIILQNANAKTLVASYQAVRSGYLFITGYASTTQGYIQVNATQYPVSTGISLQIPVVPGELSVYYGNVNFMNSITGTITTVEFWF